MEGTPYFYAENGGIFMKNALQEDRLAHMMARPIPKKKIGVVRLQMVKQSKTLYGMRRFSNPKEAVQMVRPLFQMADREMVLVLSLNAKLEPMALEIAAVGGVSSCYLDLKSIFKHALLNNASYIVCFHNHVSGYAEPSDADKTLTERISDAGHILGLPLIDHIIVGDRGFFSFREEGLITLDERDCYAAE